MEKSSKSYRSIFKATALFGSVQVITILLKVISNKVIAVLLGTSGIGLIGLFTSTITVLTSIFDLGLYRSSVQGIAEAHGENDIIKRDTRIIVYKRIVWIISGIGAVFTIIFSRSLSQFTFGNTEYTISFIWLSLAVFFTTTSRSFSSVLQGVRLIKELAKSSILGTFLGVAISVPLYYIFGVNGIVPSLIISSVLVFLNTSYFVRKVKVAKIQINTKATIFHAKDMLKLGLAFMFMSAIVHLVGWLLRAYISKNGGIDDVGLFQAGYTIVASYFGLVFTAMSKDYFPRMSAINKDNAKIEQEFNQQSEIGLILIGPLAAILLLFAPFIISILYTEAFFATTQYLKLAILGILLQTGTQSLGLILLAKNNSKAFVFYVFFMQSFFLITQIAGYLLSGLKGLGFAFIINSMVDFISLNIVVFRLYKIKYKLHYLKLLLIYEGLIILIYFLSQMDLIFWVKLLLEISILTFILFFTFILLKQKFEINSLTDFIRTKLKKL